MRYRVRVAGKVFESENTKVLLKRAVEAKRESLKPVIRPAHLVQPANRVAISASRLA